MNYNQDDYDYLDINSHSKGQDDIYSYSENGGYEEEPLPPKRPEKKKKKHGFFKFIALLLCALIVFCGLFYAYTYKIVDSVKRVPIDCDLGIATSNYSTVKNIALLGIDTHEDNNVGRSDAVVVMSIDKAHNKIKLISLARDSYVAIEGHDHDKLTHAYAYGRSGLAVKTINQNYGLEITDYVTVNFFEFARIIDYVGGVTVDVDEAERVEMNTNIIPWLNEMGIECDLVETAGTQLLTGGQAVCYSRIRHTDSDIERGNRQKEVLTDMFARVKKMNPLKLPKLVNMVLSECETSLATKDIMSLGIWAILKSPKMEQLSVPNDRYENRGGIIKGGWYYIYDLDEAAADISDFIFEKNGYPIESQEK